MRPRCPAWPATANVKVQHKKTGVARPSPATTQRERPSASVRPTCVLKSLVVYYGGRHSPLLQRREYREAEPGDVWLCLAGRIDCDCSCAMQAACERA